MTRADAGHFEGEPGRSLKNEEKEDKGIGRVSLEHGLLVRDCPSAIRSRPGHTDCISPPDRLAPRAGMARLEYQGDQATVLIFQQPTLVGLYRAEHPASPATTGHRVELVRKEEMETQLRHSGVSPFRRLSGVQPDGPHLPPLSVGQDLQFLQAF